MTPVNLIGTLHAYLGLSDVAHAKLVDIDLNACLAMEGVVGVITAKDIIAPGYNGHQRQPSG